MIDLNHILLSEDYHWYSGAFSDSGAGHSKQDYIGKKLYENLRKRLANRMMLLVVWPFSSVDEWFQYSMSPQEWHALEILRGNRAFRATMSETKSLDIINEEAVWRINVELPDKDKRPSLTTYYANMPEDLRSKLDEYVAEYQHYEYEFNLIDTRCRELLEMCNTPGQIYRVWPALIPFMDATATERNLYARAASPVPLKLEECRHKAFYDDTAAVDLALAESLVLPDIDVDLKTYKLPGVFN